MCGIVGYVGSDNAAEILLNGLRRLEYRGYDSSGIAVIEGGSISVRRSAGKLRELEKRLGEEPLKGSTGIGHTRWATHGRPSLENAHPHSEGGVAVVHNGIIENYLAIRGSLRRQGVKFRSDTDTEVICHLIFQQLTQGVVSLKDAVKLALGKIIGSFALAVIYDKEPDKLIVARMDCPLVIGLGDGKNFVASDITAILDNTRRVIFLDDGEVAVVSTDLVEIEKMDGSPVEKGSVTVDWTPAMAEKAGYRHYMLKEIFEQPSVITDTFRGRIVEEKGDVIFDDFDMDIHHIERIYIVACGTSWHAALVGKFLMEKMCRIPTEVDLASEFRYRSPIVSNSTLVIAISQSGETADTIAAVKEAKKRGASVLSICNVLGSSLERGSDSTIFTHAGPEIGVASTKAFTTQLIALYLFSFFVGRLIGVISHEDGIKLIQELVHLPGKVEDIIIACGEKIEEIAKKYFHYRDFLYIGRGINYPIALEGALKLKEISYIHAEGYPAGEMKHGPIALIDEDMPVVALAPNDRSYAKIISNIEETKARGARVIVITTKDVKGFPGDTDDIIRTPVTSFYLTPVLMTIPLQLLAYHMAVLKGTDVDQPRNLAKSVTVE